MTIPTNEDWAKALRFAALPRADSVVFSKRLTEEDGIQTIKYVLASLDQSGATIGDPRDYDLLKAAITPLENLADRLGEDAFRVQLSVRSGRVEIVL